MENKEEPFGDVSPKLFSWIGTQPAVTELPIITLDDIPSSMRESTKALYDTREWERCGNVTCPRTGTHYKLMKCAGCGVLPGRRTLYCSRACQRADRASHIDICQATVQQARQVYETKPPKWRNLFWKCLRKGPKRIEGLGAISGWAFDQILQSHPSVDIGDTYLTINFSSSSSSAKGRIVPVTYKLGKIAGTSMELPPPYDTESSRKFEKVYLTVDNMHTGVTTRKFRSLYTPQWPWIFATIASMGNHHRHLAGYRLHNLFILVQALAEQSWPHLHGFQAPTNLDNDELWELPDFARWQGIFGNVVCF